MMRLIRPLSVSASELSVTRGKDPKIRVYKGKEKKSRATPTTSHRSLEISLPSVNSSQLLFSFDRLWAQSVNSNFSLVSTVEGHVWQKFICCYV